MREPTRGMTQAVMEWEDVIQRGVLLKAQMKNIQEEYKGVRARVEEMARKEMGQTGKRSLERVGLHGIVKVVLFTSRVVLPPEHVGTLKKRLRAIGMGSLFKELFQTVYKPTARLRKLVADGDDPNRELVADLVQVQSDEEVGCTVTFKGR